MNINQKAGGEGILKKKQMKQKMQSEQSVENQNQSTDSLSKIIAEINKTYGDEIVFLASELKEIKRYASGSPMIDYATGGGWPAGRIVELFGPPGSGKTVLSLLAIAQVQKLEPNPKCIFIDAEATFDAPFAKSIGVQTDKLAVIKISEAEKTFELLKKIIKQEHPHIIVIDSLASLMPIEDIDKTQEIPVMAARARVITRGLGVLNAVNRHTLILCTNQIRANLKAYGAPTQSTGGFAAKHYASIRVDVRGGEVIIVDKQELGKEIKFKVVKSKTNRPNLEGTLNFYYNGKLDIAHELFQLASIHNLIKRAGAWYELYDNKYQGSEGVEQALKDSPELYKKLYEEIMEAERKG